MILDELLSYEKYPFKKVHAYDGHNYILNAYVQNFSTIGTPKVMGLVEIMHFYDDKCNHLDYVLTLSDQDFTESLSVVMARFNLEFELKKVEKKKSLIMDPEKLEWLVQVGLGSYRTWKEEMEIAREIWLDNLGHEVKKKHLCKFKD